MDNLQNPILELCGYGVSYGRKVVLASVDLALRPGRISVLMGPVKAGKSTLMRSLSGHAMNTAIHRQWGSAKLAGEAVTEDRRPALVLQHAAILNTSVRDALILHRRKVESRSGKAWNEFAATQLATHGLEHLAGALDTLVFSLPVEQQRMVNILSNALVDAPLLMIDEPTFGLDDLTAERLIDWISRLMSEKNSLLVSLHHQRHARRLADEVILLGGGRVLAHEPAQKFFSHHVNDWVDQFVRTGSLSIASPDARAEDLSSDVELPPPLPAAALAAIQEFQAVEEVVEESVPSRGNSLAASVGLSPNAGATLSAESVASSVSLSLAPSTGSAIRAQLPRTSNTGVADGAKVGKPVPSAYRGPNGFHWIVPGKLAGCGEPGLIQSIDYDLDLLRQCGITYLVTLTERDLDQDALARNGLKNLHLPIYDREAPTMAQAYMLVYRMQTLLDQGAVLTVHCKAGIGRTGTMLAAWLIREGGLTAVDAIARLRAIDKKYVQTQSQEDFLARFEEDIFLRLT